MSIDAPWTDDDFSSMETLGSISVPDTPMDGGLFATRDAQIVALTDALATERAGREAAEGRERQYLEVVRASERMYDRCTVDPENGDALVGVHSSDWAMWVHALDGLIAPPPPAAADAPPVVD